MSNVLELTDANFDEKVLRSAIPVLIDFWSPTCGPCRMLAPVLDALAETNEGDCLIAKVNVADYPQLGAKYDVSLLPTLLFFHKGNVVERMNGVQSQQKIQSALDELD